MAITGRRLFALSVVLFILIFIGKKMQWRQHQQIEFIQEASLQHHEGSPGAKAERILYDPNPMQEAAERLKKRRDIMLETCNANSLNRSLPSDVAYVKNTFLKTSLFFSDKYKIIFCQIPKCATRNQAKFLAAIEGLVTREEFETMSEAKATHLIEARSSARRAVSIKGIQDRIEAYRKVVIVREPFSRLLSAFRNKLEGNRRKDSYANLARRLHAKYGKGTGEETNGAPVVSLNDFISYLTDVDSGAQVDQHWNYFNRLCAPCDLKYNYVVHVDTMDEDMAYIMKEFAIDSFAFPPSFNSFTDMRKVEEYFSNASPQLVNALYHRYKLDYALFGFPPPPQF